MCHPLQLGMGCLTFLLWRSRLYLTLTASSLLFLSLKLKDGTMEDKPVVVSKQKTEVVCGVPTQVICTAFSSHILVVVTQFGKMGTLVSLEPSNVANDISKPVLTTKVLLGQDEVKGWEKNLSRCHLSVGCLIGAPPYTPKGTVSILQDLSDLRCPGGP